MLEFLKQLMGRQKKARRPTLDLAKLNAPVEAARLKLEAAQADHAATREKANAHASALSDAIVAFDADGGHSNADGVLEAQRAAKRHSMFTERTQRIVDRAAAAHHEAEATRDATVLQKLDEIFDAAGAHINAEWLNSGLPAVKQLVAFFEEVDQILSESESAGRQSSLIRNDEKGWLKARQLDAVRGAIRVWVRDAAPNHIDRL